MSVTSPPDTKTEAIAWVRTVRDVIDVDVAYAARSAFNSVHAPYVDLYWLPVLGPTATVLWRRLADQLGMGPFTMSVPRTAAEVGVKPGVLTRAMERLVMHNVMGVVDGKLLVRRTVALLTPRSVTRLPDHLQADHDKWRRG